MAKDYLRKFARSTVLDLLLDPKRIDFICFLDAMALELPSLLCTFELYQAIIRFVFENLTIGRKPSATFFSRPPSLKCLKISLPELLYHKTRYRYFGKGSFLPQSKDWLALSHTLIGRRRGDRISSPIEMCCRFLQLYGNKALTGAITTTTIQLNEMSVT